MSIYAVNLAEWYPPGDEYHSLIKWMVSNGAGDFIRGCPNCGKKHMHWQQAYGHHSLPWGYGEIWCRKKCYINYYKKIRNK